MYNNDIVVPTEASFQVDSFDLTVELSYRDALGNSSMTPPVVTSVQPGRTLPPGTLCTPGPLIMCADGPGGENQFGFQVVWRRIPPGPFEPAAVGEPFRDGGWWRFPGLDGRLLTQVVDNCQASGDAGVFLTLAGFADDDLPEIRAVFDDFINNIHREFEHTSEDSLQDLFELFPEGICDPGQ